MYAYTQEQRNCKNCGEVLPPYLTRHHLVIVFTALQVGQFREFFKGGEFVLYSDIFPTVNVDDSCKGRLTELLTENQALKQEIQRMKKNFLGFPYTGSEVKIDVSKNPGEVLRDLVPESLQDESFLARCQQIIDFCNEKI